MQEVTAYLSRRGCLYTTESEAYRDDVYAILKEVLDGKDVLNIDTLLNSSVAISDILSEFILKSK